MFLPSFLALRKAASDGNLPLLQSISAEFTLTPKQIETLMVCAITNYHKEVATFLCKTFHKGNFTESCRIAFVTIGDLKAIRNETFHPKPSLKDQLNLLKVACDHQQWHVLTEWWIGTHLRKYKDNDMHCSTILKTICEKCPSDVLQAFILHESFKWPEGALKILIETNRLPEAITQLPTISSPIWAKYKNVSVDSVVALASRIRLTIDLDWFLTMKHYDFVLDLVERFHINMTVPFDDAIEVCKGLHVEFASRNFHPIRYMTALQNEIDTFEARRITEICNEKPSQKELQTAKTAIRMIRTATSVWQWQFDAREWILFLLDYYHNYKRTQEIR